MKIRYVDFYIHNDILCGYPITYSTDGVRGEYIGRIDGIHIRELVEGCRRLAKTCEFKPHEFYRLFEEIKRSGIHSFHKG